jgi:hypothetical protein
VQLPEKYKENFDVSSRCGKRIGPMVPAKCFDFPEYIF